jgi:hypothetical protein
MTVEPVPPDTAVLFDRLPPEEQALRRRIAEGRAKAGTCMLCDWLTRKHRPEDFPERAQKKHLWVCCNPALPSNVPYL